MGDSPAKVSIQSELCAFCDGLPSQLDLQLSMKKGNFTVSKGVKIRQYCIIAITDIIYPCMKLKRSNVRETKLAI